VKPDERDGAETNRPRRVFHHGRNQPQAEGHRKQHAAGEPEQAA
jgi:hypothetical protein